MANLFYIHTPFQLFIAQQIIYSQKLVDNIMLYGYIGNNHKFVELYDFITVKELWSEKYYIEDINNWPLFNPSNVISGYYKTRHNKKKIDAIISRHNVSSIFLGDVNNLGYQLLMYYYSAHNIDVIVFEEGLSHYVNVYHNVFESTFVVRYLKTVVSDILFYVPIWHKRFAKNIYLHRLTSSALPIAERYSIRPYYREKYDKILYPSCVMSEKVINYIKEETDNIDTGNAILFLSEPFGEFSSMGRRIARETLKSTLSSLSSDLEVLIKFHPRETLTDKEDIIAIFRDYNIKYRIICEQTNIPIEYFLQVIRFRMILTYLCSSVIYNGYLYPQIQVKSLLPQYYKLAIEYNAVNEAKIVNNVLNSRIYKLIIGEELN